MPRYCFKVAYDGTDFHGWQKQHPPESEPLRTVQGVLEGAVREAVREEVTVVGASRTDSGVHARGQVAAFSTERDVPLRRLAPAINSRLPADVQVRGFRIVPIDFSPITDAVSKGYRYRLAFARTRHSPPPLFDRRYCSWTAYNLNIEDMQAAAQHLRGEHDFASFTRVNHGRESTVRTILDCSVTRTSQRRCQIDISGNGFLYNMVRIIAGTLLDVGRGKFAPHDIAEILKARDRAAAGATLPPEGLCLMWISYD